MLGINKAVLGAFLCVLVVLLVLACVFGAGVMYQKSQDAQNQRKAVQEALEGFQARVASGKRKEAAVRARVQSEVQGMNQTLEKMNAKTGTEDLHSIWSCPPDPYWDGLFNDAVRAGNRAIRSSSSP